MRRSIFTFSLSREGRDSRVFTTGIFKCTDSSYTPPQPLRSCVKVLHLRDCVRRILRSKMPVTTDIHDVDQVRTCIQDKIAPATDRAAATSAPAAHVATNSTPASGTG